VAVLKVGCPWKIGGREPCSKTPTYDISATAGDVATTRIPAATGTTALSKGHQQEKAKPQEQKRQQQQELLYVEKQAVKVAGNETRNMAVNVSFGDNIN
jgi:hypothetical protein